MISHLDTSQPKRGSWSITGAAGYYNTRKGAIDWQ